VERLQVMRDDRYRHTPTDSSDRAELVEVDELGDSRSDRGEDGRPGLEPSVEGDSTRASIESARGVVWGSLGCRWSVQGFR